MAQTANSSGEQARKLAWARRRAMSQSGKAALSTATATAQPKSSASAMSGQAPDARTASRARREAMASRGKAGIDTRDRSRADSANPQVTAAATQAATASDTRNKADCGCGCKGEKKRRDETTLSVPANAKPVSRQARVRNAGSTARAASLARRLAMSSKGKAALSGKGPSAAQTARNSNPNISSRELAQTVREERSNKGKCRTGSADSKCRPTGRMRPGKEQTAGAQDAPWKVGASETAHGQTVTGTMVGRAQKVTGDEPSTCRAITGTEYLGADIFRQFCQSDVQKTPRKVSVSPTSSGNRVSGNELGRSANVTGDEPGTCKRVTGNQYVGANQSEAFCGTKAEQGPNKITGAHTRKGKSVTGNNVGRSEKVTGDELGANRELTGTQYMQRGNGKAPAKVGSSATLRGGSITGTMVGRNERVTGDEPGSCRNVTGDDYIGSEQFKSFCGGAPAPTDRKVGVSQTLKGKAVTGTMTGRGGRVTGDEPGTCKAVTGTPYAGAEQYQSYCAADDANLAAARTRRQRSTPGAAMTGLQPGIYGKLTGAGKGACEPLTGTPYVGADQFAAACPATAAEAGSPDFPQPIGGTPWGQFSVEAPSHASHDASAHSAVTGTRYEQGNITGPFGKAGGKVTGTEEARFGHGNASVIPQTTPQIEGRIKSRISGEGMDAGIRVTGDDWDRGDNVTGTEGMSAIRRNPTRRGEQTSAMAMQQKNIKRNEELPTPVSKVTGGSGNTEKGALITYSGGARG